MDVLDVALRVAGALEKAGVGYFVGRQWRDVVEILRQSGAALDAGYLEGWAERLGVAALLASARAEAR